MPDSRHAALGNQQPGQPPSSWARHGELQLEFAPTKAIALALVAAIAGNARGLAFLERDPSHLPDDVIAALRSGSTRAATTCT